MNDAGVDASVQIMWWLKNNLYPHAHTDVITCTQKHRKHTYIKIWRYDCRLSPCWEGEGESLWFLWVWWSWWTDNTGHMKHKDSEEMLSGVTLLEVYSHIHTVMKEKEQKQTKKKEVEDEMRVLQQLLEKWRRQRGGEEWLWAANPVCRIYKREATRWMLHDLNTGEQLSGWYGEGDTSERTWSGWCSQQQRSLKKKRSFNLPSFKFYQSKSI